MHAGCSRNSLQRQCISRCRLLHGWPKSRRADAKSRLAYRRIGVSRWLLPVDRHGECDRRSNLTGCHCVANPRFRYEILTLKAAQISARRSRRLFREWLLCGEHLHNLYDSIWPGLRRSPAFDAKGRFLTPHRPVTTVRTGQASAHGKRSLGTFPKRSRWPYTKKPRPEGRGSVREARQRCATSSSLLWTLASAACSSANCCCMSRSCSVCATDCFCCCFRSRISAACFCTSLSSIGASSS
jgi:hypothetical protein